MAVRRIALLLAACLIVGRGDAKTEKRQLDIPAMKAYFSSRMAPIRASAAIGRVIPIVSSAGVVAHPNNPPNVTVSTTPKPNTVARGVPIHTGALPTLKPEQDRFRLLEPSNPAPTVPLKVDSPPALPSADVSRSPASSPKAPFAVTLGIPIKTDSYIEDKKGFKGFGKGKKGYGPPKVHKPKGHKGYGAPKPTAHYGAPDYGSFGGGDYGTLHFPDGHKGFYDGYEDGVGQVSTFSFFRYPIDSRSFDQVSENAGKSISRQFRAFMFDDAGYPARGLALSNTRPANAASQKVAAASGVEAVVVDAPMEQENEAKPDLDNSGTIE